MLNLEKVSLEYSDNKKILDEINLSVNKGQCLLITGESGSGKSSIINCINGLAIKYDGGTMGGNIKLYGQSLKNLELYQISMMIASVFQNPKTHFFNVNTTLELLFYLENIGLNREEMDKRMEDMLSVFPICHLLDRDIFDLSGGEKQILCIASSYISGCKLVVLDEPSSNLDDKHIDILRQMLEMLKQKGISLVVAEHRIFYLKNIVDRVLIIENGTIKKEYTNEEFFSLSDEELSARGLRSTSETNLIKGYSGSGEDLIIKDLVYKFNGHDRLEIKDLSFSLGGIYGIIGKNGCGKSTFLRLITGLDKKSKDKIVFKGKIISPKDRLKMSSLVMQDVNHQLFSDSVENELILGCNAIQEKSVTEIIDSLGLGDCRDRHPMSLSGGQKQRVAIASAICKVARFIFMDEPTSGMDYKNMSKISRIVRDISSSDNIIFIVSHDKEFLNMTVDEVVNIELYRHK